MTEIAYLVCMRVDELDDPVVESTTTACVECGSDIWISAASRKEMSKRGAMPICSTCAERLSKEHPEETRLEIGELSEEQFAEVEQHLREKAVELGRSDWLAFLDGEDLDAFDALMATAAMAAEAFEDPQDDWGTIVVMVDYEDMVLPPIPLSKMMNNGVPKEMIAKRLIPAMASAAQAKRVLFGISSWTLAGKEAENLDGRISDHPDRMEALILMDVTADGVQRMAQAEIIRDGVTGPKLGAWRELDKPERSAGLFVDALIPTLQLVRTLRDV